MLLFEVSDDAKSYLSNPMDTSGTCVEAIRVDQLVTPPPLRYRGVTQQIYLDANVQYVVTYATKTFRIPRYDR